MIYIASYNDLASANAALDNLIANGVHKDRISVATLNDDIKNKLTDSLDDHQKKNDTGIGEVVGDTVGGIVSGGVLGAIGGLLVGMAAIAIPGLGGLLVAGPLAAALGLSGLAATTATGATIGGTVAGASAFVGALIKAGLSDNDAQELEKALKDGGIIVAVETDNEADKDLLINAKKTYKMNG